MQTLLLSALFGLCGPDYSLSPPLPWVAAKYEAQKLFMRADLAMELETLAGDALNAVLTPAFKGEPIRPHANSAVALEIRSGFSGKTTATRLYVDPTNWATLRMTKQEWSSEPDYKDLRYTQTGIARLRAEPQTGDELDKPASWGQQRRQFRPFPPEASGLTLSEPTVLPYVLATAGLAQPGDSFRYHAMEDGDLITVEGTAREWTNSRVRYRRGTERIEGSQRLLLVVVTAGPAGGKPDANFELLGLRGTIRVLLDVDKHLPVEISGSVPVLGQLRFLLESVKPSETG